MPGETIDVVTRAATLLREAAETLRTAALDNPNVAEQWQERARAYEHASDSLRELPNATTAQATKDGIWHRREAWLGSDDPPPWDEVAFDATNAEHVAWRDAVYAEIAGQRGATVPTDPVDLRFGKPLFFHSQVVLARFHRDTWSAIFSVVKEHAGYRARNFDFASPEVHRLNAVTPLNCIGRELTYFRYFMYVVRGDEGAFRLLEGQALIQAAQHLQTLDAGAAVLEQIHPPTFERVALDGGLIYRAWMTYAGTVFRCTMALYVDGRVSMLDDDSSLSATILAR